MTRTFYFPAEANMLWLGGATQKADNNMQALRLLKGLELEPREPTLEEQNELALYTGWGDSQVLRAKFSQLREMVSEEEWNAIRTSTLNAHYTALPVIRAMWAGILHLGAHKLPSLRILDPSAGIGHFRSRMPEPLRERARWVEIELDSLTARILKQLHPQKEGESAVFHKGFQEVPFLDNQFDLVISNIPFGNYPVADRSIKEAFLKASIHDYFFAKAVSLARPGGVIAFITSRYTLDKKNKRVREWLAERTDLLAAVRLPDTTFKANAGTEVVTDILFLRKRRELRTGDLPSWVETSEIELDADSVSNEEDGDGTARHNNIYCEHPEWLVGEVTTKRGMYRSGEYTLRYDGERSIGDIAAEILCSVLPEDGLLEGRREETKKDVIVKINSPGHAIPIPENTPLDHRRRLEGLREIYDGAQKLLDMEVNGLSTESIESQREALNGAYNRFLARFGPITNKLHQKLLGNSPALPFLLALEYDYDPLSNSAKKALIFSESTVRSAVTPEEISTCHDALLFCLNQTGKVDLDWIASLAGVTLEQAENELAGKILWTPEGRWETADQYLSGNILEKLNAAKAMLNVEPRLKATIEALVGAMPKPLKAGQIKARLGSGWIPSQYIEAFIADILPGVDAQVTHLPQLGAWKLSVRNKWYVPAENTTRWGTERKGALELIEIGLNAGTPVVHDEIEDKRVLNREATLAAQAKLEELKARFETWLWQDSERAENLAQIYNARFNVFARPRHDGSHLTFPGLSKFVTPRPLQKDAVWFALQSQAALVGDEVGLGKTLTAILSIKEAIRLGTAHKALIVVPNHLTEQWRDAFLLAYPNAQILCAGKDDFKKGKRGEFLSRIATGRWDAVIVPQSSFKLLPVSPEVLNRFIEQELDELQTFLQELKAEDGYDRRAQKEIVKAIKRFEAKLVTKSEMDKDSLETITWERLGVDLLVSDEFHLYKNLYFHTKMTRIAGLPNADSQRAFDMFIKVRNLLENGGRFIGLTGTPITNTMAEAFTMQRYFQYDTLRDLGLAHFDSWAQMFADTVMLPEMTPDGGGFRVNTRLARFTNIPELAAMLSQYMIMRRWQQVAGEVERPSLYGGKPVTVSLPGSAQLKEFVKELAERAEAVRGGHIDPRVDNMLRITGEGRKATLDMRLLFPGAPDLGSSKINTAAWVISQIYHRATTFKSAQLVFCDLGTPKPHRDSVKLRENEENGDSLELEEEPGFDNVYADLKAKLVGHGVQAEDIAFIHDAKNPTARSLLFEAVREGRIRILIGSTEKMGTGMNVQTKAVAMHHLDAPWRPADLEQREGRLLRQGNCYPEVFSFVYITEGSFDGFIWQILETKARFIAQFLMGQTDAREIDDVSETVLSMAEIKALASGNPKIIERVMVQNELLKLEHLRTSWQSNRRDSQRRLAMSEKELEQVVTRIGFLRKAAEVRDSQPGEKFTMTVAGSTHTERRLAGQALIAAARDLKLEADRSGKEARKHAGTYRGFTLWLRACPTSERSMYELVRVDEGGVDLLLDYGVPQVLAAHVSDSETGTVMSIDAVIRSIDGEIGKNVERQEYLTRQIETFRTSLTQEWEHTEKLGNLTGRLAVLDRELLEAGVNLPDSIVTTSENSEGESIEVVRTEAVVEVATEAESAQVEFDLESILQRLDELHAAMPMYEEPVVSMPSPAQEAIPITPEVVSRFERDAQAAQAMADLGRSLLSGGQMSLDAWLGAHPVDPEAKKKTTIRKKKEFASNETVQLTLF